MAEFNSWNPFDIRSIDFGAQYTDASSILLGGPYKVNGVNYPDALVLEFGPDGNDTLEFYGHDITVKKGVVSGGSITAVYGWFLDSDTNEWYYNLEFRGFEISAKSLHEAQLTKSRLDDRTIIKAMFAGDDTITLSNGRDRMSGFGGDDTMAGGAGKDRLSGGQGADELQGGKGNDVLSGNTGPDLFVFNALSGHDTITDFKSGEDQIKILDGATSFADLTLTQEDKGVLVVFGDASILLQARTVETVAEGDFLFA